ncbi:MAG: ClpX C4-type zinc finger protein [Deltaproteobacteria bacterium]|nr:ClpX C4-type zinc finger protein [Deltaproteobacteria bacterium]
MPIDAHLLATARNARRAHESADWSASKARSTFNAAVASLAASGATVREIGHALGMSHQRVHQLIGYVWCSFCGAARAERGALVVGNRCYICDRCIAAATRVVATGRRTRRRPVIRRSNAGVCSFCGHSGSQAAAGASASICAGCLRLSRELADE